MMNWIKAIPVNRENRWPLPVQLAVFALIEALMIAGTYLVIDLVYQTIGAELLPTAAGWAGLSVLTMLLSAGVVALCTELQRCVTFGGAAPRGWTVLPLTTGFLALSLVELMAAQTLMTVALPVFTESLAVYEALYPALYVAMTAAFCAMLLRLRRGGRTSAALLAAAAVALAAAMIYTSFCASQLQLNQMMQSMPVGGVSGPTVTFYGDIAELPEGVTLIPGLPEGWEGTAEIVPDWNLSGMRTEAPEPVPDSSVLGTWLMWLRIIPLFFVMRRWLYRTDYKEEGLHE